ncbi:metal-dependent transcriptional regulator [Frigoribacterium sp. CFBP 13712]|uniref:metal-dependent transcriptional regulator n=1 Tax=Frigoribacterium sp. CFBP 13712 TaxID=2775309 RepID=UPI001784AA55|nr:metal-dependent transcriptional regulator [Frigoribacterium sp. CFBP 13712]MBD8704690.1 metal-dependent transcriptional regulator [Frigoribacterium sp. CFBP 13712]
MPTEAGSAPSTMTENYLKVIWKADEWAVDGDAPGITTNEIAATLGVGASTVSGNLRKLERDGFIDYEPYRRIALTDTGRAVAIAVVRRHRLIETYLVERLGYGWDEVHDEAEILEHAVSDRLLEAFDVELGRPTADPHGDPIPASDGTTVRPVAHRLGEFAEGECGYVVRVSDDEPELLRYLSSLDLRVGAHVRIGERRDYAGSMQVVVTDAHDLPVETVELAGPAAASVWANSEPHTHV